MKDEDLEKRIVYMARMVARSYLRGLSSSEAVLDRLLKQADETYGVDELTRAYLTAWLARVAADDLKSAVEDARRDRLLYRQFQVVYDSTSWGPIDVARTIAVYPGDLQASMTYVPAFSSPDLLLLGEIVSRSLGALDEVMQGLRGLAQAEGEDPLPRELNDAIRGLEEAVDRLMAEAEGLQGYPVQLSDEELRAEWERLSPYAPRWLSEAWNAYRLLKYLREGIRVAQPPLEGGRYLLVMLAWRLYELYVAGIVLEALRELGYGVKVDDNRFVLMRDDNEAGELLLNSDMEGSRLASVDSDKEIAKKARGRPDISLKDNNHKRLLVIECKFSDDPNYLTAGRFKAMAYLYEYGAQLGALVFPELNSEGRPYDGEDEGTRSLWSLITREDGLLKLSLRDGAGQALYLIRVDPAEVEDAQEAWKKAKGRVRKVLEEFLG
ncbi:MAG: hypothetical protein GU352_00060 [Acidilobus sp.]|jgi:hypothetical protein|nr:hypothetical protein [Acidilobus sp.]